MMRLPFRRRKIASGSKSMTAQAAVWDGWGTASDVAVQGRLAEAAYHHVSASRMEEEFLWGQSEESARMARLAHDLGDVHLGIDMDLLETPNVELWKWLDRARVWASEEHEWRASSA